MKTIEEIAEETVRKIEPSLARQIESLSKGNHPEIHCARIAFEDRQARLILIVTNALTEAINPLAEEVNMWRNKFHDAVPASHPPCPKCNSASQVWENQITHKVTCHRVGCEGSLPDEIKRVDNRPDET